MPVTAPGRVVLRAASCTIRVTSGQSCIREVLEKLSRRDEPFVLHRRASIRPETAQLLADALVNRGDYDEAIAVSAISRGFAPQCRAPEFLGKALQDKGLSREAGEVLEAAVAASRAAIRLKPENSFAHHNLGFALLFQGKLDEAIVAYREAIRLKPDYVTSHFNSPGLE